MRKRAIIITSIILCLFLIIAVVFRISTMNRKESNSEPVKQSTKNMDENKLNPFNEVGPTNPPDSMTYYMMLDGALVTLDGDYQAITANMQKKIDQSQCLGVTVESVKRNEEPTDELQTNFLKGNWSLYYYKDEFEESYIFVNNNQENQCYYQKLNE